MSEPCTITVVETLEKKKGETRNEQDSSQLILTGPCTRNESEPEI